MVKIPLSGFIALLMASVISVSISSVYAAPSISAQIEPNTIELGESSMLEIIVSGTDSEDWAPQLSVLSPQYTSQFVGAGTIVQVVNGSVSKYKSKRYQLTPKSTGLLTIPELSITRGSATIGKTRPIQLRVVARGTLSRLFSKATEPPPPPTPTKGYRLVAKLNKSTVFVGEPVELTLTYIGPTQIQGSTDYKDPQGAWSEPIATPQSFYHTQTSSHSDIAFDIVKRRLYAIKPGKVVIPAVTLQYLANGGYTGLGTVQSAPVSFQALPLPEQGKPHTFSGNVGQLTLELQPVADRATQNQPITFQIKVIGSPTLTPAPELTLPTGSAFRILPASVSGNTREYAVIPLISGTITLPPFSITYFNPKTHRYETARTPSHQIRVSAETKPTTIHPSPFRSTPDDPGWSIRITPNRSWAKPILTAMGIGLLCLSIIGLIWGGYRLLKWGIQNARHSNIGYRLRLQRIIKQYPNDPQKWVGAFSTWVSGLAHHSINGLSYQAIKIRLMENRISETQATQISAVFQKLEAYRYAKIAPQDLQDLRAKILEVIRNAQ